MINDKKLKTPNRVSKNTFRPWCDNKINKKHVFPNITPIEITHVYQERNGFYEHFLSTLKNVHNPKINKHGFIIGAMRDDLKGTNNSNCIKTREHLTYNNFTM